MGERSRMSGISMINAGHCHPDVVEAIRQQDQIPERSVRRVVRPVGVVAVQELLEDEEDELLL